LGNPAWLEHHQKLEDHFSGFLFTLFLWEPKLLRGVGWLTIFVFLPERMKNHDSQILGFSKLKKHKYHSRQHEIDFLHHTSWFLFLFHGGHTNVKIISRNFYLVFEKSSWPPYSRRKTLIGFLPVRMEVAEETDSQKLWSLRYFWTTVVKNPSFSEWHFDRGDFGLKALLYFGNFSGRGLLLGNPFNFKLPVQNWDLLFLR
jgi:hypothetical protein